MSPLDNLRRLVAGWRGEWRVDAHAGVTLSHDGDEWPIGALDGDAVIMLVELLNAIRPAVDGATAEIERLTAELVAEQDKRSDAIRERNEAEERARSAEAGNRVLQAEVVRMDAELAAARAVPPDDDAPATVDITTAIKSVERIESTSKALGYSEDYMAAIDRVLSCLRAVAENGGPLTSTVDGRASQPATVGGLLATAPVGSIVEWLDGDGDWNQAVVRVDDRIPCAMHRWRMAGRWCQYGGFDDAGRHLRLTARLVPAHLADADPASRGPIGEG